MSKKTVILIILIITAFIIVGLVLSSFKVWVSNKTPDSFILNHRDSFQITFTAEGKSRPWINHNRIKVYLVIKNIYITDGTVETTNDTLVMHYTENRQWSADYSLQQDKCAKHLDYFYYVTWTYFGDQNDNRSVDFKLDLIRPDSYTLILLDQTDYDSDSTILQVLIVNSFDSCALSIIDPDTVLWIKDENQGCWQLSSTEGPKVVVKAAPNVQQLMYSFNFRIQYLDLCRHFQVWPFLEEQGHPIIPDECIAP